MNVGKDEDNNNSDLIGDIYRIKDSLNYALAAVIALIALVSLFLIINAIDFEGKIAWTFFVGFLLLVVVGFSIIEIPGFIKARRTLKAWEKKYIEYAYIKNFGFGERDGEVLDDVIGKLGDIYPDLGTRIKKNPEMVKKDAQIKVKSGSYTFDCLIGESPGKRIAVEVHKSPEKMSSAEVGSVLEKVEKVRSDLEITELLIVSTSGFDEKVSDHLGSLDGANMNRNETHNIYLIDAIGRGYTIEWYGGLP